MLNLNYSDQINDQINNAISDLRLSIVKFIKENLETKVSSIYKELTHSFDNLSIDKIRNIIKREIRNYVELKGLRRTDGYYIKLNNSCLNSLYYLVYLIVKT